MTENPADISYTSYALIRDLLDREMARLVRDWQIAVDIFCGVKGEKLNEARDRISSQLERTETAKAELKALTKEHYAKHPNQGVREFWGCTGEPK